MGITDHNTVTMFNHAWSICVLQAPCIHEDPWRISITAVVGKKLNPDHTIGTAPHFAHLRSDANTLQSNAATLFIAANPRELAVKKKIAATLQ
jgi:hypothetical protein